MVRNLTTFYVEGKIARNDPPLPQLPEDEREKGSPLSEFISSLSLPIPNCWTLGARVAEKILADVSLKRREQENSDPVIQRSIEFHLMLLVSWF